MVVAVIGGLGLNGYRTFKAQGALDNSWYVFALITLIIMGTIFFFIARYANKPEKED